MLGRHRLAAAALAVAVAVAVAASVVACGGGDEEGIPAVDGPTSPQWQVQATEMAYDPDAIAVEAGEVDVVLQNAGTILHDLRIEDRPAFILEATAGETVAGSVALDPGRYRFYCSLPGHREAGMEGVLEVR